MGKYNCLILQQLFKQFMSRKIYLNLPVKDLKKSISFFTKLGFAFNPQFTDENGTCMIVNDEVFVMLLLEKFFKSFIDNEICDTTKSTEVIVAMSVDSKTEVDDLVQKAITNGGKTHRQSIDHGWMMQKSFYDLDGHIWEIFFMDVNAMPKN